jgi:hypothetical protein
LVRKKRNEIKGRQADGRPRVKLVKPGSMLKGEARRNYMRAYMRRRRAGLPTKTTTRLGRPYCSLCWNPPSRDRILISAGQIMLCEVCISRCAKLVAAQRPPIEDEEG